MIIMHALMQGRKDYSDALGLGFDADRSLGSGELYSHGVIIFEGHRRHQETAVFFDDRKENWLLKSKFYDRSCCGLGDFKKSG